jgi:cytochrome b
MKPEGPDGADRVRVWDAFVRLFHWSLVVCFATAWLSANASDDLHMLAGYAAGGLVLMRLVWGVIGTRHARFSSFVRSPGTVLAYLRAIAQGTEARHLGHNPAGGAMILALLAGIIATALTGWLLTTDTFWGVTWMQHLHHWSADAVLLLVAGHLAGVALASLRHRENLVGAMIVGQKRALEPTTPAKGAPT